MVRICFAAFLLLAGCATSGGLGKGGYKSQTYPYEVAYSDPARETFINTDWRVDNFFVTGTRNRVWEMKETPDYVHDVSFDTDGDGTVDEVQKLPRYDLWLEHRATDQTIWVRSMILSQTDAHKNLDVISRRYLEAVTGTGYAVASLQEDATIQLVDKKYAATKIGEQALSVGPYPALVVAVDVANLHELELDSTARQRRVLLVFVRTGYGYPVTNWRREEQMFPTVLVAGYASSPADFDAGLPAFRHLLSNVRLYGGFAKSGKRGEEKQLAGPAIPLAMAPEVFDFARVASSQQASPATPQAGSAAPVAVPIATTTPAPVPSTAAATLPHSPAPAAAQAATTPTPVPATDGSQPQPAQPAAAPPQPAATQAATAPSP